MTPADAKSKIADIRANKDHAFHRGDPDAVQQMLSLQGLATGNASVKPFSAVGS
jgi:hypothetical protein